MSKEDFVDVTVVLVNNTITVLVCKTHVASTKILFLAKIVHLIVAILVSLSLCGIDTLCLVAVECANRRTYL